MKESDTTEQRRRHIGRLLLELSRHFMDTGVSQIRNAGFKDISLGDISVFASIPMQGTSAKVLADKMKVSKQAVSQKIDSLERRGYVKRSQVEADGRAWHIVFTKKGLRLFEIALAGTLDIEAQYRSILGDKAFAEVKGELQKLALALEAIEV